MSDIKSVCINTHTVVRGGQLHLKSYTLQETCLTAAMCEGINEPDERTSKLITDYMNE